MQCVKNVLSLSLIAGPKATGPPSERSWLLLNTILVIDTRDALPDTLLFGVFIGPESDHCLPLSLTD